LIILINVLVKLYMVDNIS